MVGGYHIATRYILCQINNTQIAKYAAFLATGTHFKHWSIWNNPSGAAERSCRIQTNDNTLEVMTNKIYTETVIFRQLCTTSVVGSHSLTVTKTDIIILNTCI